MEASRDQFLLGCLTLDVLLTFQNPGTIKQQEELPPERLVGWNGIALPRSPESDSLSLPAGSQASL